MRPARVLGLTPCRPRLALVTGVVVVIGTRLPADNVLVAVDSSCPVTSGTDTVARALATVIVDRRALRETSLPAPGFWASTVPGSAGRSPAR